MENRIIELYDGSEPAALLKKARFFTVVSILIGAAALAVCIFLCTLVTPLNTGRMLLLTFAVSTLGGWIVISIVHFVIAEYKNAARHTESILNGKRECVDGRFSMTRDITRIRRGVTMQCVAVEGSQECRSLQLYIKKKKRFDAAKAVRVYTVFGFVVAYEAADENN